MMSEWNKIKLELLKRENKEQRKDHGTWHYAIHVDFTFGNSVDYIIFVQIFLTVWIPQLNSQYHTCWNFKKLHIFPTECFCVSV